ncbi:hypothetical protein PPYR_02161 [Photinus pyralis]|uniref:Large ribosomal subunit protein bL9m n=1 Tax=Photinus pyralis TaxID=7054 RepID=A0A1Y1MSE5_PHOPY|nr:39S ribosomal protein L9, mitochondrial [Photinus pyralis]KAB0805191.1 hypothetical protein PPYR_02161 [Photinus pyralis]
MLKTCNKITSLVHQLGNLLLKPEAVLHQQLRTTFILKRKHAAPLHKKGMPLKRLRAKHYIYELVKDTDREKKPNLDLILTHYVDNLGNPGDKVSVKNKFAYDRLLLPGLAVYATPENLELYKDYKRSEDEVVHSSPYAVETAKELSKKVLSVVMNMDNPWTIQPWHIKASFRKCGYVIPEDAVTLPAQPITGPNIEMEDKEFFITVTINNFETVDVRCRIHHWTTDLAARLPHIHEFWKENKGTVFPANDSNLPEKEI